MRGQWRAAPEMKPAPFDYLRPQSLAEALALKSEHGDGAMFLAGGQSLVPAMNFRMAQPAVLIDIGALDDQATISKDPNSGALHLGSRVRHRQLECDPQITAGAPLLAEAAPFVAHAQIRNRGTLCGNLAHADPASEFPAVMLALDASLRVASSAGEREIPAQKFFLGIYTTALQETEMLVEVILPAPLPHSGHAFVEMARRPGDYAQMGVAVSMALDEAGLIANARIALCSASDTPVTAHAAATMLIGESPAQPVFEAAANTVDQDIAPLGSVHASAQFQRHLARVLTRRALAIAAARASEKRRLVA